MKSTKVTKLNKVSRLPQPKKLPSYLAEWEDVQAELINPTMDELGFSNEGSSWVHKGWPNHDIKISPIFKYFKTKVGFFGIEMLFVDKSNSSKEAIVHEFTCNAHHLEINIKKMVGFAMEVRRRKLLIEKVIADLFPAISSLISTYGYLERYHPPRGFNFALQKPSKGIIVDLRNDEKDFIYYLERDFRFFSPKDTEWTPSQSILISYFLGHVSKGAIEIQDSEWFSGLDDVKARIEQFLTRAEAWSVDPKIPSC